MEFTGVMVNAQEDYGGYFETIRASSTAQPAAGHAALQAWHDSTVGSGKRGMSMWISVLLELGPQCSSASEFEYRVQEDSNSQAEAGCVSQIR